MKKKSTRKPSQRMKLSERPDPNRATGPSGSYIQPPSPFPTAAGGGSSGPSGLQISPSPMGESENEGFQTGVKRSLTPVGNSGTQVFAGYFSEEYLQNLRGRRAAKKWDEMRRSEAQISMLMNATMNPIKAANWEIEPFNSGDPASVKHCELVKTCIFDMIDFNTFKHESLTLIPFGFSLFEVVHSVELNHPKFGTFNGLKSLAFRSQKTIENWTLEPKTGKLLGVNQYTFSDLGANEFIPGEFLLCLTLNKEGDNYEGISALRPMFGAYVRKELYLQLCAIGVEKYAIGTPVGTVPKGKEKSAEYAAFIKCLQSYTSHESAYIVVPEGWKIEIQQGTFDASKIKELLVFENTEFANAMVANFLALGMNGGGGAYALGSNLGEFYTAGIQAYADLVCDGVNRGLIPNLVKLNFGDQPGYPKMKVTGISDKAGLEYAQAVKAMVDGRCLDPDKPFKEHVRKLYKMPAPDPTTAVELPELPAGAAANYAKPGTEMIDPKTGKTVLNTAALTDVVKSMKLADPKYVKIFDANKSHLKLVMSSNLASMYADLKALLRTAYKKHKVLAATKVDMPGLQTYKGVLRNELAIVARQAVNAARKQVPSKKNIKLAENVTMSAAETRDAVDAYDALTPAVRKLIDAQSTLIAETQAADIEKMSFFQFTASATSSDNIDAILFDVDGKVIPALEGGTKDGMSIDAAAGDAVARVTQESALSFLFDPEVLGGIESFTFTNEDPVSDICQELADTTFAPDDPDLDRYTPPLHHNCKSRLVPNLIGDSGNPDIDRGGVSLSKDALKSMTLHECRVKL